MESAKTLYLYGRSGVLQSLQNHVFVHPEQPVLVHGPSGIGKSALLERLTHDLRSSPENILALHYRVVSQAHSLQHLLGTLVVQLIERTSAGDSELGGFRRSLKLLNREYSVSLITAGLLDLASAFAPNLKKTTETLIGVLKSGHDASSPQALAETIAKKSNDDLLAGFTQLLDALSKQWPRGVILVDQLEAGSQAIQDASMAILKTLPPTWGMIVAVNDEIPDGIVTMRRVRPPIEYKNGVLLPLQRLDLNAFEVWTCNVRGDLPTVEILHNALERCDGRPLFLQDWIRGFVAATDANLLNRLGSYYERRLNTLSADARRLLRTLAILPAQAYFSFDFCHAIVGQLIPNNTTDRTLDLISELKDNYLLMPAEQSSETYQFVHDVARLHIRRGLPSSASKASARALLSALSETAGEDVAQQLYTRIVLADIAGESHIIRREALTTGQQLIRAGSYEAAYRTFEICGALQDENLATALVGQAEVLLDTGFYADAIQKLTSLESTDPIILARADLLRGWCYLRLNRYGQARTSLIIALDGFHRQGNIEAALDAERALNTIQRDLGSYDEAVAQARILLRRALADGVSPAAVAGCYRGLARSLVLTGEITEALAAGNAALVIGRELGAARAIGNAELCLGEAYRHGEQFELAVEHYRLAMDYAERISNRDSFLWSALGLSDTFVLQQRLDLADQVLDRVKEIVRDNESRYPLENHHWRFSVAIVDFLRTLQLPDELTQVIDGYAELGITWPRTYLQQLLETGTFTKPKPF